MSHNGSLERTAVLSHNPCGCQVACLPRSSNVVVLDAALRLRNLLLSLVSRGVTLSRLLPVRDEGSELPKMKYAN
jgi:hypothetical protein